MRRASYWLEFGSARLRLGERTLVMGIVNVTPDSFSDGGRYFSREKAIRHGIALAEAGADWIDVGGESTRPGSKPVPVKEELRRVLPVIRTLHRELPRTPIAIDTTKSEVAEAALDEGAAIINDVSGLMFDRRLAKIAAGRRAGLVLMHMRGRPETMQQRPFARDLWRSLREGLARSVQKALGAGVRRSQILIDPGLGFGKSRAQNYEILGSLKRLQRFRMPILVGSSRKSFVKAAALGEVASTPGGKSRVAPQAVTGANTASEDLLLSADAAAVVAAILGGAHVVRVHDVAAMLPAIRFADAILASPRQATSPGRPMIAVKI